MSLILVLFDDSQVRLNLLPLSATRAVGNLRVGIATINEKWECIFQTKLFYLTEDYLAPNFSFFETQGQTNEVKESKEIEYLVIRSNVLPSEALVRELEKVKTGEVLWKDDLWIAYKTTDQNFVKNYPNDDFKAVQSSADIQYLNHPEDIFLQNKSKLLFDFNLFTRNRKSQPINNSNTVFGDWIFVEAGAQLNGVTLNSLDGPIYIGYDANIEEGSFLKGYTAIGDRTRVKTGARLYMNTSVGPDCTVAGEINNSVIWGNSAKGHEGYLGCSVIGQGCNIGAGSSTSNLKNNWSAVRLFDYRLNNFRDTEQHKCGLIMGDFSMVGINSSFKTGAVVGVGAQIALSTFIPKFVADFTWLTDTEQTTYIFDKFEKMMVNRVKLGLPHSFTDISIFRYIFEQSSKWRGNNQH